MVEIIEYCLVVLVSTLLAAASLLTFGRFAASQIESESALSFSSLASLVDRAISNGTSRASLLLPSLVVSCHSGVFAVVLQNLQRIKTIPLGCNFSQEIDPGPHLVEFSVQSMTLSLKVT
jgi:hypothetical protein